MRKFKKLKNQFQNQKIQFHRMPLFVRGTDKVFHIHIPKTAGRFIRKLFLENNFKSTYDNFEESVYGFEIPHLHYPLYNSLPVNESIHFSVVRNPLDRFKSCMKSLSYFGESDFKVNTLKDFEKFVDSQYLKGTTYFLPQYKFLTKKTLLWKFENGFDEKFFEWCDKYIGIKINNESKTTQTKQGFDSFEIDISSEVENIVKTYYYKDYELFQY